MFISKACRLARVPFSSVLVPKALGMPGITRPSSSEGSRSVSSSMSEPVPDVLAPVTNVWTTFIDPARGRKAAVEDKLVKMGVVPAGFRLFHMSNAMTPFLPALEKLILFVKEINDAQKKEYEKTGIVRTRDLCLPQHPAFANLFYELVVIFPEDFLPKNSSIDVYSSTPGESTQYCVGYDGLLRRAPGLMYTDARLAPFPQPPRATENSLNPLLVAINADNKFRGFLSIPQDERRPLHPNVMALIGKTVELVDHLFWDPRDPQAKEIKEERRNFLGKF